jgi:hypothetical protein
MVGVMTVDEMLSLLARALDVPVPNDRERADILTFTGDVAHASERLAAPLAAYMVGRAGLDLESALGRVSEVLGAR